MKKLFFSASNRPALHSLSFWLGTAGTCVFGVLLCVLSFAPSRANIPPSQPEAEPAVDYSPIRGSVRPLRLRRTGFTYKCDECHRLFQSPSDRRDLVAEHMDVHLNHGRNDYCLNCHHPTNRNAYVTHNGEEIPSDRIPELCAKCHGLVYRDWENGAHGRKSGFWNLSEGEERTLLCVQCHDPHNPKFPNLAPMPGPTAGQPGGHAKE
jgi:hypothetical protein